MLIFPTLFADFKDPIQNQDRVPALGAFYMLTFKVDNKKNDTVSHSLIKMSSSGDELSWGCLEQTVDKGLLPWDITVQVWAQF